LRLVLVEIETGVKLCLPREEILQACFVLERASQAVELAELVASKGNPNCLSDAGVAALTARAAADAIEAHASRGARVIASGGGARNPALIERLRNHLPESRVESSDEHGLPGDAKEAIAFAILGYETLRERAANVPRVTGASRETVLGSIVPRGLRGVLAEVENECQSL